MAYNYSDLGTEQQMIAEAKKFVNDSVANKVDKVAGKGLSTEDYTTNEKNKLAGIEPNATKTESSTTNGNIKINGTETSVYTHPGSGTNPHGTTAADVGLGNVDNTSDADKPISTATQSALSNKADKTSTVSTVSYDTTNKKLTKTINGTVSDIVSVATIKSDMALGSAAEKDVATTGNASATQVVMGNDSRLTDSRPASDVSAWAKESTKPTYTASEVGAIATTAKGSNNGVAELDSAGKVPSSQLPSYVDDVLEYDNLSQFPATGETGKIYIAKDTNLSYRWSGTGYVEISPSLALGETSSTAYRGDRGKTAYDHSQITTGNPHNVTKSDVGLGNVGNFKAVSTEASQGLTDTEKSNARTNIGAGTSNFSGSYNDLSDKPDLDSKLDKAGGTMTGSIVTTSHTAIKPQTHDTGTVGELNNRYVGGYFNTIHVKGSNANGSFGIELSGAEDAGTIEFAKEADSDESYRQVFQNKDGTLALTSDIEVSEDDIASTQTVSGNLITVNDAAPINAEDITVDITPQQDLHGYARPWAGGAGKNKLPMTVEGIKAFNTSGTWSGNTYTKDGVSITILSDSGGNVAGFLANGSTTASEAIGFDIYRTNGFPTGSYILNGCPAGGGGGTTAYYIKATSGSTNVYDTGEGKAINIASSRLIVSIFIGNASNKTFYPMIRLATETDATFAPYSNECPIEGWTGAELDRVGKNLVDDSDVRPFDLNGATGIPLYSASCHAYVVRGVAGKTVTVSRSAASSSAAYFYYGAYSDELAPYIIPLSFGDLGSNNLTATISVPNGTVDLAIFCGIDTPSSLQCELGSTTTAYEPYQVKQYTADFGETVHGGKWHVTGGGTDKTMGYFDITSSNMQSNDLDTTTNQWLAYVNPNNVKPVPNIDTKPNLISNILPTLTPNQLFNTEGNSITVLLDGKIRFTIAGCTTFEQMKTWVDNHPISVCYELATPTTINTPKQNVPMLQGINTVSADCGDTQLKYQPDNVVGELKGEIQKINSVRPKVYGFHIDSNESDPSAAVTYLQDAVGMRPAKMDYIKDVFDYGSWEDVWFVRDCKPCVLHKNGYVISYLDKNDFSKDIYGDPIYLSIPNHQVMIEFPKIWYKVVPDLNDSSSASVYISPVKLDEDYVDFAYIDSSGAHKEHFYMSAYNACAQTESGTRYLCSLSGQAVSKSLTGQNEIDACKALGTGWYTEDAGEIILINFLLILMGKSLDTKTVFGQGLYTGGSEVINDGFRTGVHNTKGMFYGTNSGAIASNNYNNAVKIFGIENYWGFQWRRYAGDMLVDGHRKIKLCYGNDDGSTTKEFNSTGDGYVDIGCTPSGTSGGYISKMKYTSNGMFSSVSSGTASTYYCSGQWYNNSGTMYALRGGTSNVGALVGAFFVTLTCTFGHAWWNLGASPSYK